MVRVLRGTTRDLGRVMLWVSLLTVLAEVGCKADRPDGPSDAYGPATKPSRVVPHGEDGRPAAWRRVIADSLYVGVGGVAKYATIETSDLLGGADLVIGGLIGSGHPSSMLRLCAVTDDPHAEPILVRGQDALEGRATLGTPEDALTYVRLLTAPRTVHCLRPPWQLEVGPKDAMPPELWGLGDLLGATVRDLEGGPGVFGMLSREEWARSGLPNASARREGGEFVVRRALVQFTPERLSTRHVEVVEEQVSRDGAVRSRTVESRRMSPVALRLP